jgi:hypothetical protein
MNLKSVAIAVLFTLTSVSHPLLVAQNKDKVLGKPIDYENPVELTGNELSKSSESKVVWTVICDRDGNTTYNSPGGGDKSQIINFRDWFYVNEVNDGWIHLCKAELEGKDGKKIKPGTYVAYGWVAPASMLLWTRSVIDPVTKIHKKAFLLNKVEDIDEILARDDEKQIKVYHSPDASTSKEPKSIYEFYFIYKYDAENRRYLIAKDDQFGRDRLTTLVGWVEERSVAPWNTRLALEPNYEDAAFKERKSNSNYQVRAYGSVANSNSHAQSGVKSDGAIWSSDPVILDASELAQTDPKRFRGGVVRFPILSCVSSSSYRSGVVGEISYKTMQGKLEKMDEVYYSKLTEELRKKEVGKDNFDILIVMEGTKSLGAYREAVIQGIRKMKEELLDVKVVRFGVSIYRDIPEEKVSKLYITKRMTQNVEEIVTFLNSTEFARWEDNDSWTASNYGVSKGLKECGLSSDNTNIVILIGNYADYSYDVTRKQKDSQHSSFEPDNELVEKLVEFNAHIVGIQAQNTGDRPARKFQDQLYNLILQSAITQYQIYKNARLASKSMEALENPSMPEMESGNELFLEHGSVFGLLRKSSQSTPLTTADIVSTFQTAAQRVHVKVEGVWEKLRQIVEDGASFSDVNAGDFAEPILGVLAQLKDEGKFRDEDLKRIIDSRKYKLYMEVYIPKKIEGADHPTTSVVLFMPSNDLKSYVDILNRLRDKIDRPANEQREALYNTFIELAGQYVGNNKNTSQVEVEQLRAQMQGISDASCGLPSRWGDIRIGDINDKRKVKDEEIKKRVEEILANTSQLESIYNQGRAYEFSYSTSNETYFWIPVDLTF